MDNISKLTYECREETTVASTAADIVSILARSLQICSDTVMTFVDIGNPILTGIEAIKTITSTNDEFYRAITNQLYELNLEDVAESLKDNKLYI